MSLHNYNIIFNTADIYISDLKPEVVEDICNYVGVDPKLFLEGEADLIVGEIDFDWLYEVFEENGDA